MELKPPCSLIAYVGTSESHSDVHPQSMLCAVYHVPVGACSPRLRAEVGYYLRYSYYCYLTSSRYYCANLRKSILTELYAHLVW